MLSVETEREDDGRWLAEVPALPGVLSYGATDIEARSKATALALRVIAERVENGEALPRELVRHVPARMSGWPAAKASRVLAALLRIGWTIKRQSGSHRTLQRPGLRISYSLFMMATKSARACWRVSPNTPD